MNPSRTIGEEPRGKPEIEKIIKDDVKYGRSAHAGEFFGRAVFHYLVARELGEEYSREQLDNPALNPTSSA